MTFAEKIANIKSVIDNMITSETSVNDVAKFGDLKKSVDELQTDHDNMVKDYSQLKDRYIDAVKNYGTSTPPKDESSNDGEKTFEEIGKEIISNRGKK